MIQGNDIICFSNDPDGDPLSKQHIALRLAIELLSAIQFSSRPARGHAARLGATIEMQLPLDGIEAT